MSNTLAVLKKLIPLITWLPALLALTLYYAFVITAGTFKLLSWHTDYYDLLAQSISAHQLHLTVLPKPRLLAKSNPHDYRYAKLWLWDASLYQGRYYLYWGPIPGLCLWLFKLVTGYAVKVHDQWLLLVFMLGRLYAGTALIVSYARSHGTLIPRWGLTLAILVFGLSCPTPYFMARPLVYEASIAAGQAFLFCGLFAAFRGMLQPLWRTRLFVLAGICFSCAFGSRGSLIVVAPLLVATTALIANRPAGYPLRGVIRSALALGVPVAIGLAAYGIYNQLRFDSFSEFGLKYQLTSRPFGTKNRYIVPNLVSYLTGDLAWSCEFPFVTLPIERTLTRLIRWPASYDAGDWDAGERAAGLLTAVSVCWLWLAWLYRAAISGARQRARQLLGLRTAPLAFSQRELWLIASACSLTCALAPASRMWMANMRFLQDAAGGILLGAIGAGFWLLTRTARAQRASVRMLGPVLFGTLGITTIVVGVCLGFTGHMDNFGSENPELFERLTDTLSWCR